MKLGEEVRLWGTVDTDYVAPAGPDQCPFRPCNLYEGHEGPHLEAHPHSGRIFGLWENTGGVVAPEEVSHDAVKIVLDLNHARDEALEAIETVLGLRASMRARFADSTDPHVRLLLDSAIWPKSEHEITYCGTEASHEDNIREELLDILGLNGEED